MNEINHAFTIRVPAICGWGAPSLELQMYGESLAEVERHHIIEVLKRCGGNRTHAAKRLQISVRGLRNKLHVFAVQGFVAPREIGNGNRATNECGDPPYQARTPTRQM